MKTYKITTSSTCITEYTIKANSAAEAEEKFWDGEHETTTDIDFQDETIEKTEEI